MNSPLKITNLENCFICREQVMEIDGQANYFDTFDLEESDELFLERAFGEVHSTCLEQSKWGKIWYKKRLYRYEHILEYASVPVDDKSVLMVKNSKEEAVIIYSSGTYFPFFLADLKNGIHTENGILIPQRMEINLEFNNTAFAEQLRVDLKLNNTFPFPTLLKDLNLEDYYHMDILNTSYLLFDKRLERNWRYNWISCYLCYSILLPKNMEEVLRKWGIAIPGSRG